MTEIDRAAPVMVTGATGYVAGVLVKKLLKEELTVHAPVRSPDNPKKLQSLNAIAIAKTPGVSLSLRLILKPVRNTRCLGLITIRS